MSARLITSIVAAGALALSLTAASPAQARNNDDLKRFLGAAVGLYILGQAFENQHRGRVVIQRQHNGHWKHRQHNGGKWKKRHHNGGNWKRNGGHHNGCHNGWNRHGQRCW